MELVYGIIWGIYTRYILPLSLSFCESTSNIESRDARVCTRGYSMHSTENRRVNTRGRPVVPAPVVLEREGTMPSRYEHTVNLESLDCQSLVYRNRRCYLIMMVKRPSCRVVTSEKFNMPRGSHRFDFALMIDI